MADRTITIAGRRIGAGASPYVVAELSANHNGDIGRAKQLIAAACAAGADAVKLQTYTADTITIDSDRPEFMIEEGLWAGRRLYDLYTEAHTPWDWHEELFRYARSLGIAIFSTPFDSTAVDLLERLASPAYKVASFELVDLPLIERVAATRKPIIMSTGMAREEEIREAVDTARRHGAVEIALLHCVSSYPAPADQMNLRRLPELVRLFDVVSGLSDHTMDHTAAIAAVALGGSIVEKHVTLDRSDGGVDSAFSLEAEELANFVTAIRTAASALGDGTFGAAGAEEGNVRFRRSLFAVQDIQAGQVLTHDNVRSIRPGNGLPPKLLSQVLGRRVRADVRRGTPFSWDLLDALDCSGTD